MQKIYTNETGRFTIIAGLKLEILIMIEKVRIIRNEFEKYGQNTFAFQLKCLNVKRIEVNYIEKGRI